MKKIPVLFVQQNSNYYNFDYFDCFDEKRNALTSQAREPLIAHPPCRKFSKLRSLSNAPTKEKQLAFFALEKIRRFGGILEHPKSSTLFKTGNFKLDGSIDDYGGFLRVVNLSDFGFQAVKPTMLYFVGLTPKQLPPFPLNFNAITHVISTSYKYSEKKELSRNKRSETPIQMIEYFIQVIEIIKQNKKKIMKNNYENTNL